MSSEGRNFALAIGDTVMPHHSWQLGEIDFKPMCTYSNPYLSNLLKSFHTPLSSEELYERVLQ